AFHAVLASHVPDQRARDGDGLARALRAAGVDSAVADHVKRLRDRLRASRYGPRGLGDVAELAAELAQVLRVLDAEPGGKGRRVVAAIALMALAALAQPAAAQTLSAEALYDAGDLLGAGLCWVALWIAMAARRRRTVVLGLSLVTVAAGGLAAREVLRRAEPLAIVLNAATPVRVAPYGGASPASMVEAGAALLVDRRYGAWLEVHRADGVRGWVLAAEVSRP